MKIAAAALAGALLASTSVYAAQFTGSLSLNGTNSFTDHSVTFSGLGNIGASSGDLGALGTCVGCVALNDFTDASTNFVPYSATNNQFTSEITLRNAVFTFVSGVLDSLSVAGSGIATLTGFDPTPGNYLLTTQGNSGAGLFTFSSTIIDPVSEPSTLAILGMALIGAAVWFRRPPKGDCRPPRPDCASAL